MAIPFPEISPIIVEIGPIAIRWYSMAYIVGFVLGWLYVNRLNSKLELGFSKKNFDDLLFWCVIGVIFGGRIGYALFYNFAYYAENPAEILMLWHGGMSFHGGMIGLVAAVYYCCRRQKISFLRAMDLIACAAPIGLFFGRIANFVNGELFGRATDVPWAVVFPGGGESARHPSQLYESLSEGLLTFIIMLTCVLYVQRARNTGFLSGLFLILYSVSRSMCELFREPDAQIGFLAGGVTMGQLLSAPMMALGLFLVARSLVKASAPSHVKLYAKPDR